MAGFEAKEGFRNTLLFGATVFLMLTAEFLTVFGELSYETAADVMLAADVLLNFAILCDLIPHIRRDFPFLVFVGTYNVLLLGRVYVSFAARYSDLLYSLEADDFQNLFAALRIVTLALFCAYAGYRLSGPLFAKRERAIREQGWGAVPRDPLLPVIRQICVAVLLVSSLASFYVLAESVLKVLRSGSYLRSFTQVSEESVPSVISRLSMFFIPSFAVFLATLPNRRQMKLPMTVYGVYLLATLLTGRRNTFVCEILAIVIYFVLRDTLNEKGKRHLRKRSVIGGGVAVVAAAYLLQLFAEIRAYGLGVQKNFGEMVGNFFYSQGASFRVVVQAVNHIDLFNRENSYLFLFYPFERFAHNNVFVRAFFGLNPIIEVQTSAFVQTTHNFAHVLTYLVDPTKYLSGGGFGTSYVAEFWVAYGLWGVVVSGLLIGLVFRFFSSMLTRSWVILASCFLAVKDFVYIPRNFALSWVTDTFNITYFCFYGAVYLLALLAVHLGAHVRPARAGASALAWEDRK